MAYVVDCECDVFVSFAHLDDVPIGGGPPWVKSFARDLKTFLRQRLGVREDSKEDLRVYFTGHGDLETGVNLEAELMRKAGSAATFVAVTSPAYVVDNSWTMRELNAFQATMGEGGRIFAIEHSPLDSQDEYPQLIRNMKRMAFWQKDPEREIPLTMSPDSDIYRKTLIDLGEQIRKELKLLRKMRLEAQQKTGGAGHAAAFVGGIGGTSPGIVAGGPGTTEAGTGAAPQQRCAGRVVYLAQVTYDLDDTRDDIRRYLEPFGVEVLPKETYPQGGSDFLACAAADIGRADAFVQLLGRKPALRPPDLPQGYDLAQAELALARNVPILQWLHPEVDLDAVVDPTYAEFLAGPHVVRGTLESFKADIVRRIEKPEPVQISVASPDHYVFIDADARDLPLASQLLKEFKGKNVSAAVPVLQGSSEEVRLDLEANLVECHALLMVYGETSPVWVRGQLRLYSKLKHRREQPLKALAIYLGPPDSKPDIGMDLPECRQLDCRQGLTPEVVTEFLSGLYQ